jgi:hypothetical protein
MACFQEASGGEPPDLGFSTKFATGFLAVNSRLAEKEDAFRALARWERDEARL